MIAARKTLFAVLVLACVAGSVRTTQAQCGYFDVVSGTPYVFADGGLPRFTQSVGYWTAIAVRPDPTNDWDLVTYSSPAAFPGCVTGVLASSAAGVGFTDFVIGDFNSGANTVGTYYNKIVRYSGTSGTCLAEWDSGADALAVNDTPTERTTNSGDLLEVWDVFLEAGKTYTLTLDHSGAGSLKAMLFRNPAGVYWAQRSARVLEVTTNGTYVAPTSDWYAVVVVNDNGGTDTYRVSVGNCLPPAALTSTVAVPASAPWGLLTSFAQASNYYTAIATRSDDNAQDWDLGVFSTASGAAFPTCFTGSLAGSAYGSGVTDFVVGDFNSGANTPGTFYARAFPYGGSTSSAKVEWDSGANQIVVDQLPTTRTTGPSDLIECWDISLNGGQNFGIHFTHDGAADLKLFVFRNPGAGYWVGRGSADLVTTGNTTFGAPASDWYSLVVVNDNGLPGTYSLGVAQCGALYSIPPGATLFSTANGWFEIHQTDANWMVYGGLNSPDSLGDWNIFIDQYATGGGYPQCAANILGASNLPAKKVDFVAGDFHYNTPGYYYPVTQQAALASSNVKHQWDTGADVITVDAPPVSRTTFGYKLLECWDVYLEAGATYAFDFRATTAPMRLCLMRNNGGTVTWKGRQAATFDVGSGFTNYTAPTTGWYGVVVVNDNIDNYGNFTLGVYRGSVAVDASAPRLTRLAAVSPNPTRAGARIDYELHADGEARFEVRDVAGRKVATLVPGARAPGRWSETWNGRGEGGTPLAAGMYFVRMTVGDRVTGDATVVLLR